MTLLRTRAAANKRSEPHKQGAEGGEQGPVLAGTALPRPAPASYPTSSYYRDRHSGSSSSSGSSESSRCPGMPPSRPAVLYRVVRAPSPRECVLMCVLGCRRGSRSRPYRAYDEAGAIDPARAHVEVHLAEAPPGLLLVPSAVRHRRLGDRGAAAGRCGAHEEVRRSLPSPREDEVRGGRGR